MQNVILKMILAGGFALALPGTMATAADMPVYDMDAYCQELASHGGGTPELIADCMALEQTAQQDLALRWPALSASTQDSCIEIGMMGGASYDLLKACVDELGP